MVRATAFTIIELLIAVSIIMILAGLAMENFTEAKVRSTIARNQEEFHTMATAIEAYSVDRNAYPRMAHFDFYKDPDIDKINGTEVIGVMSRVLSTPVAYLTQAYVIDPFMTKANKAPLEERLYTYQDIGAYVSRKKKSDFWPKAKRTTELAIGRRWTRSAFRPWVYPQRTTSVRRHQRHDFIGQHLVRTTGSHEAVSARSRSSRRTIQLMVESPDCYHLCGGQHGTV